jgi:hypothetical protein
MIFRKGFIIFATVLLLNSQCIEGQQRLADFSSMLRDSVFKDPFDNNKNKWITDNEYVSGKFENGCFILKCKNYKGSGGLDYVPVALDLTRDFEIEASFEVVKGSGGLVFGMNDKFDHYRVELTDKNDIVVLKNTISKNKLDKLFTVSGNSLVKKGSPTKVKISKLMDTYYLSVNDSIIKGINNIKPEGERVGFNVAVNSEISADYLKVSYLRKVSSPLLADKSTSKVEAQDVTSQTTKSADAPVITWISPSRDSVTLSYSSQHVRARVKSDSKVVQALFNVNGKSIGEADIEAEKGVEGSYIVDMLIDFKLGTNKVFFTATNEKQRSKQSEIRHIINPVETKPNITWSFPKSNSGWTSERITIEACITSPTPLKSVDVLVNGDSRGKDRIIEKSGSVGCDYLFKRTIDLREGYENRVTIIAENEAGSANSNPIAIFFSKSLTEKRIALVIGNSIYKDKPTLKNPENDANLMAGELEKLDFRIIKRTNADKKEMTEAIMEFNQKLDSFNVALFYYAGHGIQVDGVNYLVPTDAKLESKINCEFEAISLNNVVNQLKRYPDNTNIVILDACRNDPFREWARGSSDGFKFLPSVSGTLIGYATAEGAKADDGNGANGLYTEELVKQMQVFQPIESVFKKTMVAVEKRTNFKQSPQVTLGLRGDFYFAKPVNK